MSLVVKGERFLPCSDNELIGDAYLCFFEICLWNELPGDPQDFRMLTSSRAFGDQAISIC